MELELETFLYFSKTGGPYVHGEGPNCEFDEAGDHQRGGHRREQRAAAGAQGRAPAPGGGGRAAGALNPLTLRLKHMWSTTTSMFRNRILFSLTLLETEVKLF